MILRYLWRGCTLDQKNRLTYDQRHKTRVVNRESISHYKSPPVWNYDGSSTMQATTENSTVHLIPVRMYSNNCNDSTTIVLCETSLENDTRKNARLIIGENNEKLMLGFELECFAIDIESGMPVGYTRGDLQTSDHYCSSSAYVDPRLGRFLDEVLKTGLAMNLSLTGHNIEVAYGQIEFQICDLALKACDDLEVLKFLMTQIGSKPEYMIRIDYQAKPLGPTHNGSGMHTNFSTQEMRDKNSKELTQTIVERFGTGHTEAMEIYGFDNRERLTGTHETSSYDKFTYGIANRAASIRMQTKYDHTTCSIVEDYTYVEDRRPNPSADQYQIAAHIYDYVCLRA